MPITHTSQGWFWGSKGPFTTREKALEVQQAAFASGYQEKQMSEEPHNIFAQATIQAKEEGHTHFKKNSPGYKRRNEIASDLMHRKWEDKQVDSPYAVATWRTKTMKEPYADFTENSPGRKKRDDIAEAIKRDQEIKKSSGLFNITGFLQKQANEILKKRGFLQK